MKLVSITITANSADIIGDALKSVVNLVDACIVIDTGVSDETLEIAKAITKNKYKERQFKWVNDFSAARNFGLEVAKQIRANWAIILDTDERIQVTSPNIREIITSLVGEVIQIPEVNRTNSKERLFRIPTTGKYIGATHEYFKVESGIRGWLNEMSFSEIPKTMAASFAKFQRDLEILSKVISKDPYNPRWLFYLGETQKNLGNYRAAITAYRNCAELNGWDEESAWACYREAECWIAMLHYQEAVNACARGLAKHPGIAELAWLAAYASYYAGLNDRAIYWANLSIAMGKFEGKGKEIPRIGFQYPEALYEKPYDVLKYALQRRGDEAGAKLAAQRYQEAYQARISSQA